MGYAFSTEEKKWSLFHHAPAQIPDLDYLSAEGWSPEERAAYAGDPHLSDSFYPSNGRPIPPDRPWERAQSLIDRYPLDPFEIGHVARDRGMTEALVALEERVREIHGQDEPGDYRLRNQPGPFTPLFHIDGMD